MTCFARRALIAIGGNLPASGHTLRDTFEAAIGLLGESEFYALKSSTLYVTPAYPAGSGPDYINAAISGFWPNSAADALSRLHQIEAELGRLRQTRWGARNIDLDLIALEDEISPNRAEVMRWMGLDLQTQMSATPSELLLPHPRMHERGFVLVPLREIAPEWRHPILGQTVEEMCAALPPSATSQIRKLD